MGFNGLNHCYFVTDNASNLKRALTAYKCIPCSCQVLATVVGNVLQPSRSATAALPLDASDYDIVDKIEDSLAQCKSVTAFCKPSGINNQLKKSLNPPKIFQNAATPGSVGGGGRWWGCQLCNCHY